mgnify:CR=1 FL=1
MDKAEQILLMFVKHPTPGAVKTRLARTIGQEEAASFYDLFVRDMLDGMDSLSVRLVVCYDPASDEQAMRAWLGEEREYLAQEGNDLGERMAQAFAWAFGQGAAKVGIIGSDVPDYPSALIERGFGELFRHDAVLGPAMDGGYYFIAFSRDGFTEQVFQDMPWSGPEVLAMTRDRLEKGGKRIASLPEWNDVDVFRDLNVLFRLNNASSFRKSRTYAKLREYEEALAAYDIDLPGANPEGEIRRHGDKA